MKSTGGKTFMQSINTRFVKVSALVSLVLAIIIVVAIFSFAGDGTEVSNLKTASDQQVFNEMTTKVIQDISKKKDESVAIPDAKKRKDKALELMATDPSTFLAAALKAEVTSKAKPNTQKYLEKKITVEGKYTLKIADNFTDQKSENIHEIKTKDGKTYRIRITDENKFKVKPNSTVRLTGYNLDNALTLDSATSADTTVLAGETVSTVSPSTVKKVAAVTFTFADATVAKYSNDQIKQSLATTAAYYKEASFNKWSLGGKSGADIDFYGNFVSTELSTAFCSDPFGIGAKVAAAQGISLSGYNNVIYLSNAGSSCGYGGISYVGNPYGTETMQSVIFLPGSLNYPTTVQHELGHSYGMLHAGDYICTDATGAPASISNNCTVRYTYGDYYDAMGSGYSYGGEHHFSASRKVALGWMPEANRKTVVASGTYNLTPIETASGDTQVIEIPRQRDASGNIISVISIEYRQPATYDLWTGTVMPGKFNGVIIRQNNPSKIGANIDSYLLDSTPVASGTSNNIGDAPLALNKIFSDPGLGLSVTLSGASSTMATLDIQFAAPQCVATNPTITFTPSSQTGPSAATQNYTLAVTNNDSTACTTPRDFNVTVGAPGLMLDSSGSTSKAFSLNQVAAGKTATVQVPIWSYYTISDGVYPVTATVQGTTISASANYIVFNPVATTNPPTVSINGVTDGQVYTSTRGNLAFSAQASDDVGVANIKLYVNDALVATCNSNLCSYSTPIKGLANGTYILKAVATDTENPAKQSSTSVIVTKQVATTTTTSGGRKK